MLFLCLPGFSWSFDNCKEIVDHGFLKLSVCRLLDKGNKLSLSQPLLGFQNFAIS